MDKRGRVQKLNLTNNRLRGSIPAELGLLTELTNLELSKNQLSGVIPPQLAQLAKLRNLILSHNLLKGAIPASFGQLSQLTYLFLSFNQLSGPIPSELGQLQFLYALALEANQLNGNIPTGLGLLPKLAYMSLAGNQLSGCLCKFQNDLTFEYHDFAQLSFSSCSVIQSPDRKALVSLYRSANGTSWKRNFNWLSNAPLSTWHGVSTDDSGRVVELVLHETPAEW